MDDHADGDPGTRHGPWGRLHTLLLARHFWTSPLNREVVRLVDPQPGEWCLDIGAGMGPATTVAGPRVGDGVVIAIEPSAFMRTVLSARRLGSRSRQTIEIRGGSAEALPVDSGLIHAAWSVNAMHHYDDMEAALREVRRVMRPGGRILLVDEDFDHGDHPRVGTMEDHDHRLPPVDIAEISALAAAAGFVDAAADHTTIVDVPVRRLQARTPGER